MDYSETIPQNTGVVAAVTWPQAEHDHRAQGSLKLSPGELGVILPPQFCPCTVTPELLTGVLTQRFSLAVQRFSQVPFHLRVI